MNSNVFADEKACLTGQGIACAATGTRINFNRNELRLYAVNGNSTTAATCGAFSMLTPGLRFVIDNTYGTGTFTLTPDSGSAITVDTEKIALCVIGADGAAYKFIND